MELEQLFENFQYNDLQWFIPVLAGLLIVLGGLLIGLFRGMTAGTIVALFFGGLMCMSPVLLDALQPKNHGRVSLVSADVARGAADLSVLNNDVIVDLSRVVTTLRSAIDGLSPLVAAEGTDEDVSNRFMQSLADTESRLDDAIGVLSRAAALRRKLDGDLNVLDAELRGTPRQR